MTILRAAVLRCCLVAMSLQVSPALAATGNELFASGVTAFKSGNFRLAVDDFQQALAAGLDSPTLQYNLGVSLYKLGRYTEAEAAFRACARDPAWAPLASYNMGLSAYQRGAPAVAEEYFEDARRTADTDEVRTLASAMLERLGTRSSRTRAILTAAAGYNDNVTLTANNQTLQTTRQPDSFAELLATATGGWGSGSSAPRWDASLYNVSYRELTENNITELLLGASQPAVLAKWRLDAGGQWQYVLREGQRFQQIGSLRFEGSREWPSRREVRIALLFSTIDALDGDFEFLAGSRQQADVSLAQPAGRGLIRTGIALERNDRKDLTTATEFFSYSPTRYGVRVEGVWPVTTHWRLEPAARYYANRYADPDRRANGVIATREDEYLELSLRAKRRLVLPWQLVAEYTYVHNTSNLPEFTYSQRLILIGVSRPL